METIRWGEGWGMRSLLALLLISILVCVVSEYYLAKSLRAEQQARLAWQQAGQQLLVARQDAANMQAYLQHYTALRQRQVLAAPNPVNWLEVLERLHRTVRFQHVLGETRVEPGEGDGVRLLATPLTLELSLPHELALLAFFAELQPHGWFRLRACNLRRTDTGLQANCQGDWLNVSGGAAT